MSTKEIAATLFDKLTENDLELFIAIFSRLYETKEDKTENKDTEKAERLARKKAAFEHILANKVTLPPDFDEKQELLDYLDERYGI
ncbi:MAG: hypothetical protein IJJ69_12285 [Oscillospiraceae bacterium]|nr:hypothetical protein [Oscillospiraceae bacterium]